MTLLDLEGRRKEEFIRIAHCEDYNLITQKLDRGDTLAAAVKA